MKLAPKDWDQYNPVVVLVGVVFLIVGGYPLVMIRSSALIVWLPRGVFGVFFAIGVIVLIRQFHLWKRHRASK